MFLLILRDLDAFTDLARAAVMRCAGRADPGRRAEAAWGFLHLPVLDRVGRSSR